MQTEMYIYIHTYIHISCGLVENGACRGWGFAAVIQEHVFTVCARSHTCTLSHAQSHDTRRARRGEGGRGGWYTQGSRGAQASFSRDLSFFSFFHFFQSFKSGGGEAQASFSMRSFFLPFYLFLILFCILSIFLRHQGFITTGPWWGTAMNECSAITWMFPLR